MSDLETIKVTLIYKSDAEFKASNWGDEEWLKFGKSLPPNGFGWSEKGHEKLKAGGATAILFVALQDNGHRPTSISEKQGQVNFDLKVLKDLEDSINEYIRSGKFKFKVQQALDKMHAEMSTVFPGGFALTVTSITSPSAIINVDNEISQQVCKMEDGCLTVVPEAIESIFGQPLVDESHVAVISITGEARTGKSFLLSLLSRYFAKLELGKADEWKNDLDANVNTLFNWRGGDSAQTKGIWISKKPFWIETKNEKIAVFLMDSQGLFDTVDTNTEMSKLFAMSALFSSFLTLNVVKKVSAPNLQALQKFAEYAEIFCEPGVKYESLLILIRDWNGKKSGFGFKAGREHIKSTLQSKSVAKENRKASDQLLNSFNKYECFALPEPGNEIRNSDFEVSKSYSLEDVGDLFLEHVEDLAKALSNEITPKKYGKTVLKGKDMATLATFCEKKMRLPNVDIKLCLKKGKYDYDAAKATTDCMMEFITILKKEFKILRKHKKKFDRQMVNDIKSKCSDEVKQKFEASLASKDAAFRKEKLQLFDQLVDSYCEEIVEEIECVERLGDNKQVYSRKVRYDGAMKTLLEEKYAEDLFEIHLKYKQKFLDDLAESVKESKLKEYSELLENAIDRSFEMVWFPRNELHQLIFARIVTQTLIQSVLAYALTVELSVLAGMLALGIIFPPFALVALFLFGFVAIGGFLLAGLAAVVAAAGHVITTAGIALLKTGEAIGNIARSFTFWFRW